MTYDPTQERSPYRVAYDGMYAIRRSTDGEHIGYFVSHTDAAAACALLLCGLSLDAMADLVAWPAPVERTP